jgi:23S rRNA (pseudouridine1915-N3)-methyltransferase
MKILILPIGKIRSRPAAELADDYTKRLSRYLPLEVRPCRDEREALRRIEAGDFVVLLDAGGAQHSSEGLSKFISDHQMRGTRRICFFIGGPDGASAAVRARADGSQSLSRMTFPHEFAQVILLEQLYRACTILRGEPYHR